MALLVRHRFDWDCGYFCAVKESQLRETVIQRRHIQQTLNDAGIKDLAELKNLTRSTPQPCEKMHTDEGVGVEVPFINVQPARLEDLQLDGPRLDEENVQSGVKLTSAFGESCLSVGADEDDYRMPQIIGQIDLIEDGFILGWACEKGNQEMPLEVRFFVNDALAGNVYTSGFAQHPLVDRICAGPANIGEGERNVAFKFRLPSLREGLYHVSLSLLFCF